MVSIGRLFRVSKSWPKDKLNKPNKQQVKEQLVEEISLNKDKVANLNNNYSSSTGDRTNNKTSRWLAVKIRI